MAIVETARQLWQRRVYVAIVLVLAVLAAILSAYRISLSPPGLQKRALTVAAASGQILVDSAPDSALTAGATANTFEALSTRAKIYGEYLASLAARQEIAERAGVPVRSISTAGPFSPASGQVVYSSQTSGERADELLEEGASNRLVFTAQEGVPILNVDAQAATASTAIALAEASFATLKQYVDSLEIAGKPVRAGVKVRELGAPEGGTIGGSNDMILMVLAFLLVSALGCAAILTVPDFVSRWRALAEEERETPQVPDGGDAGARARAAERETRERGDGHEPGTQPTGEPIARRAAPSHY